MTTPATDARLRDGRVLAVEPDPTHRRRLKAALATRFREPAQIVATADEAITAIERQLPDLVLTSSFLSEDGVRTLTAYFKARPDTSHVPIVITPQLEGTQSASPPPSRFAWLRRSHNVSVLCQADAFLEQIGEYLEQARTVRAVREAERDVITATSFDLKPAEMHLVQKPFHTITLRAGSSAATVTRVSERRRMTRLRQDQLPWLRMARLPWGTDVELVDVSRTGVLVETTSQMRPGTVVDLEFLGKNLSATVPSRVLRTSVSHVDRLGVRYRIAATFTRNLFLIDPVDASEIPLNPMAVGEILARTLADTQGDPGPSGIRARFEHEVQRLVPVSTVRIQQTPTTGPVAADSIYFTVPSASGRAVLQASFDRTRPPSATEFKILKSAAYLAAVLLEFAPFEPDCVLRALA